jgi:hypothetical protein
VGAIPHVQGLHDKYKDKGLVVMAPHCQSAERDTLEMFLLKRGVTYAVALKADTSDYPGSGIPRGALIDVDGKIIWQGHPSGSEFEGLLEKELKKVDLYGEKLLIKSEKGIAKKLFMGKLGAAWDDLEKAKAKEDAGPEIGVVIERLTTRAEAMLASATKLAEAGDYVGAEEQCKEIEKLFKGCKWADDAKAFVKELKAKEDYKTVSTAGKIWSQVATMANGKEKNAIAMAQALVAKYPETYYGKQADKVVRLLKSTK